MGPAFSFDYDARNAMQSLIDNGYAHGLMAGNALATHDLEGALLHTALGQDIYTQVSQPNGHYNHLDVLNKVRRSGSIPKFIEDNHIDNGIIYGCVKNRSEGIAILPNLRKPQVVVRMLELASHKARANESFNRAVRLHVAEPIADARQTCYEELSSATHVGFKGPDLCVTQNGGARQ